MGTRCTTVVTQQWDSDGEASGVEHLATIFRHWDGYLDGHGQWLVDFLKDAVVTNGKINGKKNFNGPGRLASGIVAALVEDGHDPDLMSEGTVCGQEYEYHVHVKYGDKGGELSVKVLDGPMTAFGMGGEKCTNIAFKGTVEEFTAYIKADGETGADEEEGHD